MKNEEIKIQVIKNSLPYILLKFKTTTQVLHYSRIRPRSCGTDLQSCRRNPQIQIGPIEIIQGKICRSLVRTVQNLFIIGMKLTKHNRLFGEA